MTETEPSGGQRSAAQTSSPLCSPAGSVRRKVEYPLWRAKCASLHPLRGLCAAVDRSTPQRTCCTYPAGASFAGSGVLGMNGSRTGLHTKRQGGQLFGQSMVLQATGAAAERCLQEALGAFALDRICWLRVGTILKRHFHPQDL